MGLALKPAGQALALSFTLQRALLPFGLGHVDCADRGQLQPVALLDRYAQAPCELVGAPFDRMLERITDQPLAFCQAQPWRADVQPVPDAVRCHLQPRDMVDHDARAKHAFIAFRQLRPAEPIIIELGQLRYANRRDGQRLAVVLALGFAAVVTRNLSALCPDDRIALPVVPHHGQDNPR